MACLSYHRQESIYNSPILIVLSPISLAMLQPFLYFTIIWISGPTYFSVVYKFLLNLFMSNTFLVYIENVRQHYAVMYQFQTNDIAIAVQLVSKTKMTVSFSNLVEIVASFHCLIKLQKIIAKILVHLYVTFIFNIPI